MLKKIILAATAFAFLGGAFAIPAPVQAGLMDGMKGTMSCRKLAKEQFPNDRAMRKAFKKECKASGGAMEPM